MTDIHSEEATVSQEEKAPSFDEIKLHLEPIKDGSTLLVPKSDCDPNISQEWLRYNMRTKIRILCTDDRLFEGEFHCIDSDGNIILQKGEWINAGYDGKQRKPVGLSLYTKKWIKKVYFKSPDKQFEDGANNDNNTTQT